MKVTIIIPVYNSSQFIARSLRSVFNQTYKDFEIILIDDHSSDNSISKIEQLKAEAPPFLQGKIKLLRNNKNRGQSFSRNKGIEAAKGEWIFFLDSDDEITPDCLETLTQHCNKHEMVIGNYKIKGKQNSIGAFTLEEGEYHADTIIPLQLDWKIYTMVWNKLIKKEFIIKHRLYFLEGVIHEDNLWSFCSAFCLEKIYITQNKTYTYHIRVNSTERSHSEEFHQENLFNVQINMLKFLYGSDTLNQSAVDKHKKEIHRFMEKQIRNLIIKAPKASASNKAKERYCLVRNCTAHWSLERYFKFGLSSKYFIRNLHFLFPSKVGFHFYLLF